MAESADLVDVTLRLSSSSITKQVTKEFQRLAAEQEQLKRDKDDYLKMRSAVAEVHLKDPIVLDIGGTRFKTTIDTLSREKGSMLAAMFSGSGFTLQPSDDGSFFIDRDGAHFRYILNYLRGCFSCEGLSQATINELLAEADFYQLRGLLDVLQFPINSLEPTTVGNGVLYHLGKTAHNRWTNPATLGKVDVSGTFSLLDGMIDRIHHNNTGSCTDARGKHLIIDLKRAKVRPTHCSLAYNGNCCSGATFQLLGSVGGGAPGRGEGSWVELLNSAPDGVALSQCGTAPVLFPMDAKSECFYQQFKLVCTGPDSTTTCCCFHVGKVELYGDLDVRMGAPSAS